MNALRNLFSNTKFQIILAAGIVAAANLLGLGLTAGQVTAAIALVGSLVAGHAVDTQKAAQVAKEIQDATPSTLDPDARLDALERVVQRHAAALGLPVVAPASPAVVAKP